MMETATPDAGRIYQDSSLDFAYWITRASMERFNPNASDTPTEQNETALVEWAAAQCGILIPGGYQTLVSHCQDRGSTITVAEALRTRGALLFRNNMVFVTHGDGKTVFHQHQGRNGYRVLTAPELAETAWEYAARVPGLRYMR